MKKEVSENFNEPWASGLVPQTWKIGIVTFIPKATPGEYRPLTLLPDLGKMFERMLLDDIMVDLWELGLVHGRQYGFLEGRGTNDTLLDMREVVREVEDRYVIGIFTDIKYAFERAWWPEILRGLQTGGVAAWILALVCNYLSDRLVIFKSKEWKYAKKWSGGFQSVV